MRNEPKARSTTELVMDLRTSLVMAAIMVITSPAFAQFEKATQGLNRVQTWMLSIGGAIFTIAFMFVGARMAFYAAQWKDVAPIFWGGIIFFGASAFATLFV